MMNCLDYTLLSVGIRIVGYAVPGGGESEQVGQGGGSDQAYHQERKVRSVKVTAPKPKSLKHEQSRGGDRE